MDRFGVGIVSVVTPGVCLAEGERDASMAKKPLVNGSDAAGGGGGGSADAATVREGEEEPSVDKEAEESRWTCKSAACAGRSNSYHRKCLAPKRTWWTGGSARSDRSGKSAAGMKAYFSSGGAERRGLFGVKNEPIEAEPSSGQQQQQHNFVNGTGTAASTSGTVAGLLATAATSASTAEATSDNMVR